MGQLPPLAIVVVCQAIALLLVTLFEPVTPVLLPTARLVLQGVIASMAGRLFKLPYWWVPINLLLPLTVVTALSL